MANRFAMRVVNPGARQLCTCVHQLFSIQHIYSEHVRYNGVTVILHRANFSILNTALYQLVKMKLIFMSKFYKISN